MLIFVRLFVCLSDEKCSKAHNIHLSLSGQSQFSLRSVPGQSQISLRSVSGLRQTEPKILRLVWLLITMNFYCRSIFVSILETSRLSVTIVTRDSAIPEVTPLT